MFSASVEIVLAIAYREAVSRRHAYVTLEHVLYALAHDSDGERILGACGADLRAMPGPSKVRTAPHGAGDKSGRRLSREPRG